MLPVTDISSLVCWELSGLLSSPVFPVFLHINKVSSCILIRYRFTNKRRPSTMETINLPRLARDSEP